LKLRRVKGSCRGCPVVPTVGPLVALIWTAVEMPSRHDRSQWWTLVLLIPGVNLIGYWFYAFTLPRDDDLRFAY
jgi:hypothetical protein